MTVVVFHLLGQTPFKPSRAMVLATVFLEMTSPSSRRSTNILGAPETSSDSPWNQVTFCSMRSWRSARGDTGRLHQA